MATSSTSPPSTAARTSTPLPNRKRTTCRRTFPRCCLRGHRPPSTKGPAVSTPYHPNLHRFAVFTAFSTFLLVIAGGLVTSTGSSLSVPDWPLSFGQVFPKMEGGVLYEHGHRMIAATVGLLVSVLMVWLLKAEPRRWVRRLGVAAFLAVVAQGVL